MLSVDEALDKILAHFTPLLPERIPAGQALGRVLAQDVIAGHDLPPFANSSMDGYAVRAADVAAAGADHPVRLAVVADIPAGRWSETPIGPGQAARIMTGAAMPPGTDAVVPVEQTDDPPGKFSGTSRPAPAEIGIMAAVETGGYVRPAGEDVRAGQTVLRAGRKLRAADLGVLAGLGQPTVEVVRRPVIAILSTGDEVLEIDQPLTPGKIHDANGYTLTALAEGLGAQAVRLGIAPDVLDTVIGHLQRAATLGADLILSSAGVSVGEYDVVKAAIQSLGALDFWKINMRPGKPLAFGQVQGIPFVGLPGNPVSAMVTFDVFVRPAILKMAGLPTEAPTQVAELAEPLSHFGPLDGRRTYARVTLERVGNRMLARSTGSQSSGVLSSLVQADGLLIIPEGMTAADAGTSLPVRVFSESL